MDISLLWNPVYAQTIVEVVARQHGEGIQNYDTEIGKRVAKLRY
jgi:hypothetical protein